MSDDPNGTLGGDYELIISSASAERIELKGKKYGNRIVMKALTEDQTWKQYLTRIKKVEDWIPHMVKLGVDAIYFCPVFESDSHGYDTRDYT